MLRRGLIFFYLFIVFTGIFAQKYGPNGQNNGIEEDDEDNSQPVNSGRSQNRLALGNTERNGDSPQQNAKQVPSLQRSAELPPRSPMAQRPAESVGRSRSTQLSDSVECAADVQRYCNKGRQQLITNLKVLQCVDDLDNVSFFKRRRYLDLFLM
jgi:hypothetical protein